jgi:hypothetical protein
LDNLALEVQVQLAQKSLSIGEEIVFDLSAESDIILEFADQLLIEVSQLGLQVRDYRAVFNGKGTLEGSVAPHQFMPHEYVVAVPVVEAVGEVEEEVAFTDQLEEIALSVLGSDCQDRSGKLARTFLQIWIFIDGVIEVI